MSIGYGSSEANVSNKPKKRASPLVTPFQGPKDEELAAWGSKLILDVGRDVKAVFRDFPRMLVFVNSGLKDNFDEVNASLMHGTNYPVNESMKKMFSASVASTCTHCTLFSERCARLKNAVLLIAELCNEGASYGSSFHRAWDSRLQELADRDPHASFADGVDIHSLLEYAVMTSGMIEKLENEEPDINGESRSSRGSSDGKASWSLHSKTFAALLLTVQGIMFYPSQYLLSRLQTTWLGHMQDSGWTIHLYPEYGEGRNRTGCICVNHCQIARHHVEPQDIRKVPRFEVEYTCTIRLNVDLLENSIALEDSKSLITRVDFDLVACRLNRPRCSCWLRTWESRARELTDKVEDEFGIFVVSSKFS